MRAWIWVSSLCTMRVSAERDSVLKEGSGSPSGYLQRERANIPFSIQLAADDEEDDEEIEATLE